MQMFPSIKLVTYCLTESIAIEWDWYDKYILQGKGKLVELFRKMTIVFEHHVRESSLFNLCDGVAAFCCLYESSISKARTTSLSVVLEGPNRGSIIYDDSGKDNIELILECDKEIYQNAIITTLSLPTS